MIKPGATSAWWRVHQWAVLALYVVGDVATWQAKEWNGGWTSTALPLVATLSLAGAVFRGQWLFAERFLGRTVVLAALPRTSRALSVVDGFLGLVLAVLGLRVFDGRPVPGVLLLDSNALLAPALLLFEPVLVSVVLQRELVVPSRRAA